MKPSTREAIKEVLEIYNNSSLGTKDLKAVAQAMAVISLMDESIDAKQKVIHMHLDEFNNLMLTVNIEAPQIRN